MKIAQFCEMPNAAVLWHAVLTVRYILMYRSPFDHNLVSNPPVEQDRPSAGEDFLSVAVHLLMGHFFFGSSVRAVIFHFRQLNINICSSGIEGIKGQFFMVRPGKV